MDALTRRTGLVKGAKLAFAAPAVVAALRAGVAAADTGTDDHSTQVAGTEGLQRLFQLRLCAAPNQQGSGLLQFFGTNGNLTKVNVVLNGLAANQQYVLWFLPVNNGTPVAQLTVTTNGSGALSQLFTLGSGGLGLSDAQITALKNILNGTTSGQLVLRKANDATNVLVECGEHGDHDTNADDHDDHNGGTRPGEGNGDDNHTHTGAPGRNRHS